MSRGSCIQRRGRPPVTVFALWLVQEESWTVHAVLERKWKRSVHLFGFWRCADEDLLQLVALDL